MLLYEVYILEQYVAARWKKMFRGHLKIWYQKTEERVEIISLEEYFLSIFLFPSWFREHEKLLGKSKERKLISNCNRKKTWEDRSEV